MMKHEFEQMAGYEVSDHTYYDLIEPYYMTSVLDKKAFIKTLNRKVLEYTIRDKVHEVRDYAYNADPRSVYIVRAEDNLILVDLRIGWIFEDGTNINTFATVESAIRAIRYARKID